MLMIVALSVSARAQSDEELKKFVATLDAHPDKVIALCDQFSTDPYGKDAIQIGALLTTYSIKSSKVEIAMQDWLLAPMLKADKPSDTQKRVFMLYTTGLLGYALKNGGKAGSDDASNVSALQNVVDGYGRMLKTHPDQTDAFAQHLTELGKKPGGVKNYIDEAKKTKSESPAPR